MPRSARPHRRQGGTGYIQRSLHVHRDRRTDFFSRYFLHRSHQPAAGIVHQYVDMAELLQRSAHRLFPLLLIRNEQQAKEAVNATLKQFGRIDILVNNAGRGLVGAVEEVTAEEVRSAIAVNVEGTLNVSRAVLPSMRARKSGHILNLSSVGGFASWPGWGIYCATKFMVEGISEAMQAELKPLGIKLTIIEPGPFRTDFLDASSLERSRNVISDYAETSGAAREWADNSHNAQPGDPAKAAAAMVRITEVENPPLRLQLGADCLAAVESKLDQVKTELNQWRDLATSTAFTE